MATTPVTINIDSTLIAEAVDALCKHGSYTATIIANTGVIAHNGGAWRLEGEVLRTGATAQISNALITYTTALGASATGTMYATPAETLANSITLKATGEATSNDDIIQKYLVVSPIAYTAA